MNEYQRALDFFRSNACGDEDKCDDCDINYSCDFQINIEKHYKTLQELGVDRMILKKQTIEKMYKCNWGIKHLFWRFYLTRKYSPATKGFRHYIWCIDYMKGDKRK